MEEARVCDCILGSGHGSISEMRNALEWVRLIFGDWVRGMSAGFGLIISGLGWFLISDTSHLRPWVIAVGVLAVLYASYRTWLMERRQLDKEITKHARPDIRGRIREAFFECLLAESCTDDGKDVVDGFITLTVSLVNHSTTSVTVDNLRLVITTPEQIYEPELLVLKNNLFIERPDRDIRTFESILSIRQDPLVDLLERVKKLPLERGIAQEGQVRFCLPETDTEKYRNRGRFILHVKDSLGNEHAIDRSPEPWLPMGTVRSITKL